MRTLSLKKQPSEPELKPWEKGLPLKDERIPSCPPMVEVVLANQIYLSCEQLPHALVTRLKRIASFSNPEFFKNQGLRLSTQGIPRFICLAHFDDGYLSLPRGCLDELRQLLTQQSIALDLKDLRRTGALLKGIKFKGELRKTQKKAIADMIKHDVGVLHAPTAFGKTITAMGLIQRRQVNTLILVQSRQLLDQWRERLSTFLEGVEIGVIGAGKKKPTGQIDVATYQSLIRRGDNTISEQLYQYGQVIIDECHHISAPRYDALLSEVHAKYVVGVTATPQRKDGHQPIVFMQSGPIRHKAASDNGRTFEQRVIVRECATPPPASWQQLEGPPHIADVYRWLMNDTERNQIIIADVLEAVSKQRHPIVLTERREHAMHLNDLLTLQGVGCAVLRGAMKAKKIGKR